MSDQLLVDLTLNDKEDLKLPTPIKRAKCGYLYPNCIIMFYVFIAACTGVFVIIEYVTK